MPGTRFLLAAALTVFGTACASEVAEAPPPVKGPAAGKERPLDPAWRPGSMPIKVGDETGPEEMALEGGRGTLEQREVDAAMAGHQKELVACADEAGPARRYLGGQVVLRFFVASTGEVSNVLVVSSTVGNFAVERCLVAQGRRLKMAPPRGHKSSDFQYTLELRPAGDTAVVDWAPEKVAREVAQLSPRLGSCGELGPAPVKAVLYIEPGGAVGSVGLASERPLDPEAASCAVDQIRRWRLCGARAGSRRAVGVACPRGSGPVARTTFDVSGNPNAPQRASLVEAAGRSPPRARRRAR
jgi:hypothetical protein